MILTFSYIDKRKKETKYIVNKDSLYKIRKPGFSFTSSMSLNEIVIFLLSDIRNLRIAEYLDENPEEYLRFSKILNDDNKITLPELYAPILNRLAQAICLGMDEFFIYADISAELYSADKVYFDILFNEEIESILSNNKL